MQLNNKTLNEHNFIRLISLSLSPSDAMNHFGVNELLSVEHIYTILCSAWYKLHTYDFYDDDDDDDRQEPHNNVC